MHEGIVRKFPKPGNLVVDTRDVIFSVGKACMLLPKQIRFIGCEFNPSCVTEAIAKLIVIYAEQVFSKESDIDGRKETRRCSYVYVIAVEAIEV